SGEAQTAAYLLRQSNLLGLLEGSNRSPARRIAADDAIPSTSRPSHPARHRCALSWAARHVRSQAAGSAYARGRGLPLDGPGGLPQRARNVGSRLAPDLVVRTDRDLFVRIRVLWISGGEAPVGRLAHRAHHRTRRVIHRNDDRTPGGALVSGVRRRRPDFTVAVVTADDRRQRFHFAGRRARARTPYEPFEGISLRSAHATGGAGPGSSRFRAGLVSIALVEHALRSQHAVMHDARRARRTRQLEDDRRRAARRRIVAAERNRTFGRVLLVAEELGVAGVDILRRSVFERIDAAIDRALPVRISHVHFGIDEVLVASGGRRRLGDDSRRGTDRHLVALDRSTVRRSAVLALLSRRSARSRRSRNAVVAVRTVRAVLTGRSVQAIGAVVAFRSGRSGRTGGALRTDQRGADRKVERAPVRRAGVAQALVADDFEQMVSHQARESDRKQDADARVGPRDRRTGSHQGRVAEIHVAFDGAKVVTADVDRKDLHQARLSGRTGGGIWRRHRRA